MRSTVVVAFLAVGAALVACPAARRVDSADAGRDPADDSLSADDYCESIVEFFCSYYLRCGRMAVATAQECRPVFLQACNNRYEPSYIALANAGLLALSSDGVAQCQAHLDTVACDQQLQDLDGPCALMWRGEQQVGAPCGFDVESFVCGPTTQCRLAPDFCGTCAAVVADGADCAGDNVTCARTSSCESGVCVARARVGDACTDQTTCVLGARCTDGSCAGAHYVGVGDSCDFDRRCPYASACIAGTCVRSSELDGECGANRSCDSGTCDADSARCVAFHAQSSACDASAQCQTGVCIEGFCSALPGACITEP